MTLTHHPAHTVHHPDRFVDTDTGRQYSVLVDQDAHDPRSRVDDKHAGLWAYVEPSIGGNSVASVRPDNMAIDAFARFYRDFHHETALQLTRRWLRIFHPDETYQLAISTIRGYTQGDWMDVVAAVSEGHGTPESHINQFRMWAFGDVWIVIPDQKAGISGIYADSPGEALEQFRDLFEDSEFHHTIELTVRAEDAQDAQAKIEKTVAAIHESDALPAGMTVRSYTAAH